MFCVGSAGSLLATKSGSNRSSVLGTPKKTSLTAVVLVLTSVFVVMVGASIKVAAVTPSGDDDSLATGPAGTPVNGWFTVDSVTVCFLLFTVDKVVTLGLSVDCFCALCL